MISFDVEEFKSRLKNRGLNDDQIDSVVDECISGLNFKVSPQSFIFNAGKSVKISMSNRKGEIPSEDDILYLYDFKAELDGVDDLRIKSIQIPRLDYSSNEVMILNMEYYPFKLTNRSDPG